MYDLVFDEKCIEFLEKLEFKSRKRIFEKIQAVKVNPFHFFNRLEGRIDYKLRVGDYRVIADINKNKQIIQVNLIEHRKKVYKN